MSEKVRRQKDIVKNATSSYLEATQVYQDYLDGASPLTITYYQIADEASRTDTTLDNAHEVVGSQSSLYYYRIKNVKIYSSNALDITTQLTQRSIESFVTGDFVMTPDLGINPRPGEFFAFQDDVSPELSEHLFQITDVQFDKATSSKYFRCSFKLYSNNTDHIFGQVIKKFVYDPSGKGNSDGVGDSVLITEEAAANKESLNNLIDGLIDKFEELFYDTGMDTFTYQKALDASGSEFEYYWSPYLCHFIYKNKILEKTQRDFLTEIYVQDINETNFPAIYSERGYKKSIYGAIELDDSTILDPLDASCMEVSAFDLNKPLSLPFFSTASKYKLIEVNHPYNNDFWMGAFNWVNGIEDDVIFNLPDTYFYSGNVTAESNPLIEKILSFDGVSIDDNGELVISDEVKSKVLNKTYYHLKKEDDKTSVDSMFYLSENYSGYSDISTYLTATDLDESQVDYLVWFMRCYFSHSISLTDDIVKKLNEYYYENSIRTYILLPIIIYILQNYEGETDE